MPKTAYQLEEDNYYKAGTVCILVRQVVGLYQNPQSVMLNQYFNTAGYSCAMYSALNAKDTYIGVSVTVV